MPERTSIPKPPYGSPCNGCGVCCSEEACALANDLLDTSQTPCPALEWNGRVYRCGLVDNPGKYLGTRAEAGGVLSNILANALGCGMGCDSDSHDGEVVLHA